MDKIQNNATVVANESANVAVETTSINHLNSKQMGKKEIATGVAQETVANATTESVNAAENAASNNQNQKEMQKGKKKVVPTTKIAIINGEEVEITVAYTKYSKDLPEYNEKLCENLDLSKMLPVIHNFALPQIFWKEGVKLYDRAGHAIEEGTDNVYVDCSTADSWRVWIDKKLERVEVHAYNSVKEYAQVVGCSNLYSRGLNNTEKIGVAALATGNKAYQAVFEFAKEHDLTPTTANLYLDVKMTKLQMMKMSTGFTPKVEPVLGRSVNQAEVLLSQAKETFGEYAQKRYVIRAINSLVHQDEYDYNMILAAMQKVPEIDINKIKMTPSDSRESTISSILTKHIKIMIHSESEEKAA